MTDRTEGHGVTRDESRHVCTDECIVLCFSTTTADLLNQFGERAAAARRSLEGVESSLAALPAEMRNDAGRLAAIADLVAVIDAVEACEAVRIIRDLRAALPGIERIPELVRAFGNSSQLEALLAQGEAIRRLVPRITSKEN